MAWSEAAKMSLSCPLLPGSTALALGAASQEIQQWRKSILGFTSTAMIQVQGQLDGM